MAQVELHGSICQCDRQDALHHVLREMLPEQMYTRGAVQRWVPNAAGVVMSWFPFGEHPSVVHELSCSGFCLVE
jgi:hypothetical protein